MSQSTLRSNVIKIKLQQHGIRRGSANYGLIAKDNDLADMVLILFGGSFLTLHSSTRRLSPILKIINLSFFSSRVISKNRKVRIRIQVVALWHQLCKESTFAQFAVVLASTCILIAINNLLIITIDTSFLIILINRSVPICISL